MLRDLIALLTGKAPVQFVTVAAAADGFAVTLGQRRVLLVVDDMWRRANSIRSCAVPPQWPAPCPTDRDQARSSSEALSLGVGEQLGDVLCGRRTAKMETLPEVTAKSGQPLGLRSSFDTCSGDGEVEVVAE